MNAGCNKGATNSHSHLVEVHFIGNIIPLETENRNATCVPSFMCSDSPFETDALQIRSNAILMIVSSSEIVYII